MLKYLLIIFSVFFGHFASSQCDATFSATISGNSGQFTATSAGVNNSHFWTFGDGGYGTGSTVNHGYSLPGAYVVTHFLTDSLGNCSDSVSSVININFQTTCSASFSIVQDSIQTGLYHFISSSTATGGSISSYEWIINGVSHSGNPTFSTTLPPGNDSVCLMITTTAGCTSSSCQTITVPANPGCNLQGSISYYPIPSVPGGIQFFATPYHDRISYTWQFGDGTGSAIYNPPHVYNQNGTYSVSLILVDTVSGCTDSTTINVPVTINEIDSCTVDFTYNVNPSLPGDVSFTATSNENILWQHWTFESLAGSYFDSTSIVDPIQSFPDSGIYTVCVYVITNSGCQATICKNITINDLSPLGRYANVIPVFPNPVNSSEIKLNINLDQGERVTFTIYNISGIPVQQSIQNGNNGNNLITIPVGNLKTGQYFIDIRYGNEIKRSIFLKI
jgi:PKD repeat protein